jgi:hypothetical protein
MFIAVGVPQKEEDNEEDYGEYLGEESIDDQQS